jgi:hypothetical protein
VGVAHTVFKNGGSWSYFICPKCGRRAKRLWLVDDAPRCVKCCWSLGVRYRAAYGFGRTERLRERDRRVDRLQAMLEGGPMRFKPEPPSWGDRRLDRRNRLTAALERARIATRLALIAYQQQQSSEPDGPSPLLRATNHPQPQSRQSQTSNCSGWPNQPRTSKSPSTRLNQPSWKPCKAMILKRD